MAKKQEEAVVDKKATSKIQDILVEDLVANEWNPNVMAEDIYLACKNDIKRVGVKQPLIVWRKNSDGKRIIIDGEHRWRIAEELGIKEIPCEVMEEIEEVDAKIMTITMNRFRGDFDQIKLAQLISDISSLKSKEELETLLGMSQEQLQSMEDLLKMDFDQFQTNDPLSDVTDNVINPEDAALLNDFMIQVNLHQLDMIETALSIKGNDRAKALVEICAEFLSANSPDKYAEVKARSKDLAEVEEA